MRRRRLLVSITVGAVLVAGVVLPTSAATAAPAKKKPKYKVSASASASTVRTSSSVKISGTVSPKSRATVKLQRYYGKSWHTLATKKLTKKSKYSFTAPAGSVATTLAFRVTKAKTKKRKAGVSRTVRVKVVAWGTVKAWGANGNGQLGNGTVGPAGASTPATVVGLTEVTKVAASTAGATAFALRSDGTVAAWGYNNFGQLGRGSVGGVDGTPKTVAGLTSVKDIVTGAAASYALRTDGTVWSWGYNGDGELGTGATGASVATPAKIGGLSDVRAIAASRYSGFALKNDGTVWSWGYNNYGDLGRGSTGAPQPTPAKIALSGITSLAAQGNGGIAVGSNGAVWTWGQGSAGQLGNGQLSGTSGTPVSVSSLSDITQVAAGFETFYAVGRGGLIYSWGSNTGGALGDGFVGASRGLPGVIGGLTGVRGIGAAYSAGYAIASDGTLRSWGTNSNLELGNGGGASRSTPVVVPGLANVTSVSGGAANGYAVVS